MSAPLISVVVPHMPGLRETDAALKRCVASLRGHDELLVIVNNGWGFARSVNLGLMLASGDYLIVANNDTELQQGSLIDLCVPDAVTAPKLTPHHRDELPRSFYCMPRTVYETVGGLDEQFEPGYFEDDDMIHRFRLANVEMRTIPSVVVEHLHGGGTTMSQVGANEAMNANRERFITKWGADAIP